VPEAQITPEKPRKIPESAYHHLRGLADFSRYFSGVVQHYLRACKHWVCHPQICAPKIPGPQTEGKWVSRAGKFGTLGGALRTPEERLPSGAPKEEFGRMTFQKKSCHRRLNSIFFPKFGFSRLNSNFF